MSLEWSDWRKLLGPGAGPVSQNFEGVSAAWISTGVGGRRCERSADGSRVARSRFGGGRFGSGGGSCGLRCAWRNVADSCPFWHRHLAVPKALGWTWPQRDRKRIPHSGSLPVVEAASLEADLARRDFSINAMALVLAQDRVHLLDPHGERADLQHRRLVLLHAQSLADDPTRIWRGVRFMARLNLGDWGRPRLNGGMMHWPKII